MLEYSPPVSDGLRGSKYLDEQNRVSKSGCYALRLSVPGNLEAAWHDVHDVKPDYWNELVSADGVVYVGAAGNIHDRLRDHIEGKVRQTALCAVCPPHHVIDVWTSDTPFEDEYNRAKETEREHPGWFVHSN